MFQTAEALPAGDMHPPNQVLQLEWFYMSFHQEDRAKYVESGQRLIEETLESLAENYENIFNSQVQMDHWQRSANARSSNALDATCIMSFARGTMERSAT
jgi:hypothetical protein